MKIKNQESNNFIIQSPKISKLENKHKIKKNNDNKI